MVATYGVVFEFRLPKGWGVGGDEDKLCLAGPDALERALVSQRHFALFPRVSECLPRRS